MVDIGWPMCCSELQMTTLFYMISCSHFNDLEIDLGAAFMYVMKEKTNFCQKYSRNNVSVVWCVVCGTLAACLRRCMSGCATCLPLAAVVAAARSRSAAATSRAACSSSTCGSGLLDPRDMAPSFTTSHSCTAQRHTHKHCVWKSCEGL